MKFDCELAKEMCIQAGLKSFVLWPRKTLQVGRPNLNEVEIWANGRHTHFALVRSADTKIFLRDYNEHRLGVNSRNRDDIDLKDPRSMLQIPHWIADCEFSKKPAVIPFITNHSQNVMHYRIDDNGEVRLVPMI